MTAKKTTAGVVYEAPAEFPNANDRGFGKEQILQLPGATEGNVEEGIGEVLRLPGTEVVEQDGPYTIVIGDENPFGSGGLKIRLLETDDAYFVLDASATVNDYRGQQVHIEDKVKRIANDPDYNDWDHNQLGDSENEIANTVERLLQNPDEVYEGTRTSSDGATVTVYVKEMFLNGNKVILFALVVDGILVTTFVPAGEAPAGSNYEDVYSRDYAINYIIEEVLKTATGTDSIEKIEEFNGVIEQYDKGDRIA